MPRIQSYAQCKPGIPRIIHMMWRNSSVPHSYKNMVKSFARMYGSDSWQFAFWSDESIYRLASKHAMLSSIWSKMTPAQRMDTAPYVIVQTFGGIYVDLDMEALQSWEGADWMRRPQCTAVLAPEPREHSLILRGVNRSFSNSFLASSPGHKL